MSHPSPGDLLELHFGELAGARRAACEAHVSSCAACAALLADVAWAERALASVPGDAPPSDGLERVLRRVEPLRPARERRAGWLRAALPSAAAIAAGLAAARLGGAPAALLFFAAGTLLTLAAAPVLILESQRRS